ncbi:MAG: ketoacyl-ACP synthase III [Planctomycetes bacterium]|nr:ketoacyl-ACP synthase III [Planctomycetota bacterium]
MKPILPVGIAGIGSYVPEGRLTNADLEKMVDTSDEWILQRTGIRERRIARQDEIASTMGIEAARRALEDARMAPDEIDMVLCSTVTPDQPFPATCCAIAHGLGMNRAGGFDIEAACSGFVYGIQIGASFVASRAARNVLLVGTEKLSTIVDYKDRNTCVLFGDGAGAVVLTSLERAGRGEYLGGHMGMEGGAEDILGVPGGGSRHPASHETVEKRMHYMHMGGTRVFRFAVATMAEQIELAMKPYGYQQLGLVVPHQVNQRIIEAAAERVGLPIEKFFVNIDRYGNTSSASVAIALDEAYRAGRLEKGKIQCMVAFGAGMAWGHSLVRW